MVVNDCVDHLDYYYYHRQPLSVVLLSEHYLSAVVEASVEDVIILCAIVAVLEYFADDVPAVVSGPSVQPKKFQITAVIKMSRI